MIKVIKKEAKSIFTKTGLPGCDFVINQYVGCEHGCLYCYAKFMSRWRNYGKWGNWVEAKTNAPELVKGKYVEGEIFMSSVSDCYQPIEANLKLTRKVLENLDKRAELGILTKSDLVLRDIDLFKEFKNIDVGLTINGFKREVERLFEPNAPSHRQRVKTLKVLKENGIGTYGFVSPIIPGLVDVKRVIKESKDFVDYFWFEVLNLRASGQEFIKILRERFPESYEIMTSKEKLWQFIKNLKEVIKKENIKTAGIEVHLPKWRTIKT